MADPTATFVLTARDQTAAAIKSADRNLKTLGRSVTQVRSLFASFGVALSVRAFAGWIQRAVEAKDLTVEQTAEIREAQIAINDLSKAWDGLGRSVAAALAPAIGGMASMVNDARRAFDPTETEEYKQAVSDAADELSRAQTSLKMISDLQAKKFSLLDPSTWGDLEDAVTRAEARVTKAQEAFKGLLIAPVVNPGASMDAMLADMKKWIGKAKIPVRLDPKIELEDVSKLARDADWDRVNRDIEGMKMHLKLTPEIDLPTAEELRRDLDPARRAFRELGETLNFGLRDQFTDFLLGAEVSFKGFLKRMAAEFVTSAIFKGLAGLLSGGTSGGLASFFGGLFGGARAGGGPVSAGKSYLVGERGPELFTPGSGGMIAAGAGSGSTVNVVNNIDARGADSSVLSRLPAILDANNAKLKAELRDMNRRGRF